MIERNRFPLDVVVLSALLIGAVVYALRVQDQLDELRGSCYRLQVGEFREKSTREFFEKSTREFSEKSTRVLEVYRGGVLLREYTPDDGDVYRELVELTKDPGD